MDKMFVTIKTGKATIQCRPEDVATIMSSLNGSKSVETPKKVYEESSILHKAIRNIQADTPEDLVLGALANRTGLHTVFSGLNEELRMRFGADPKAITEQMIKDGLIKGRPAKKGFYISK